MNVTETEAAELACPKLSAADAPVACMASVCMWWRWSPGPARRKFLDGGEIQPRSARKGFCGVAGAPMSDD